MRTTAPVDVLLQTCDALFQHLHTFLCADLPYLGQGVADAILLADVLLDRHLDDLVTRQLLERA
jgi:hypothetical protein